MKNVKSYLYAIRFVIASFLLCGLILILGLYFCNILKDRNEASKSVSFNGDTVTYVIDAGHGGEDAGAIADDGTLEKDLNLEIAFLLNDILELNGNSVKMTRRTDTLLYDYYGDLDNYKGQKKVYDLKNRLKITNEFDNSVYVGIHMNKFPSSKYKGLQVYYSPNAKKSADIASTIKDNTRLYLQKDNRREIKKADSSIYILNNAQGPAVLVECGFLSNDDELKDLKSKDYQVRLSLTLFCSLMQQ